jgi:hypothetical protein
MSTLDKTFTAKIRKSPNKGDDDASGSRTSAVALQDTPRILREQADYYRARAPEYDQWWLREGRYDRGQTRE